jgi:hypothetical protein
MTRMKKWNGRSRVQLRSPRSLRHPAGTVEAGTLASRSDLVVISRGLAVTSRGLAATSRGLAVTSRGARGAGVPGVLPGSAMTRRLMSMLSRNYSRSPEVETL